MSESRISIVIAKLSKAKFARETLSILKAQTYLNFGVIAIEDDLSKR